MSNPHFPPYRKMEMNAMSKNRKTQMKIRMTNNEFYNPNSTAMKFKATLDEGVDDIEPIRSILNEEDLVLPNHGAQPRFRKGKKIKMVKQQS